MDEDTKELILTKDTLLNQRIDKVQYITYKSLFEKSNFLYTIIDNDKLTVPLAGSKDYLNLMEIWRKNIGIFISNTIQFNSLVLSTSYEDVLKIGEVIEANRPEIKVFIAKEGYSMANLVSNYKKAVDTGELCCLVGTEQYYTGLSLEDKYLKEMFLAKIPFNPPKGQVGKTLIKGLNITKDENYYNQVLMKFMQGIGRAIRDYNDKAILYILDARLLKNRNLKLKMALDNKGIEVDYFLLNTKYKKGLLSSKNETISTDNYIYTLFFSYFVDKTKEEIFEIFELDKENLGQINSAIFKILEENINIEKIMSIEYFNKIIDEKSYKNIWILLLKIYSIGMKLKGRDIEKEIIENDKYGFDNLIDISKHILKN